LTSAGDKWLSFSIGEIVQQPGQANQISAHSQAKANGFAKQPEMDDDIPF
jgi:hypothetical protein